MSNDTIKKLGLVLIVFILLFPILPRAFRSLLPTPMSFSRMENELMRQGLVVLSVTKVEPPQIESIAQVQMMADSAYVTIYHFDDEGHIAKQMEYMKPDPGTGMVEAMGIAQALGARVAHQIPTTVKRNGMYLLVVMSEDKALNEKIGKIFDSL